ncbi:MAG TPA: hypothetical protein VH796_12005 [Nitrososphaeraceae archaeon]
MVTTKYEYQAPSCAKPDCVPISNTTATCPKGWVATGGGFSGSGAPGVFFYASQPSGGDTPNGWFVAAFNTNPGPNSEAVNAQVICARAP